LVRVVDTTDGRILNGFETLVETTALELCILE